jgi:hypothetical protein
LQPLSEKPEAGQLFSPAVEDAVVETDEGFSRRRVVVVVLELNLNCPLRDELPVSLYRPVCSGAATCAQPDNIKSVGVVSVMPFNAAAIRTHRTLLAFDDEAFVHSSFGRYLQFLLWPWQLTYFEIVELRRR